MNDFSFFMVMGLIGTLALFALIAKSKLLEMNIKIPTFVIGGVLFIVTGLIFNRFLS